MNKNVVFALVAIAIIAAVAGITIGLQMKTQPSADGQTQLKHADLVTGAQIIVHGVHSEGLIFDEGYGSIYTQGTYGKYLIYADVHWAISSVSNTYGSKATEFIVYAWND